MPYTRISGSDNGREAIKYARGIDGKGHNNNSKRNLYIDSVGMLPDDVMPFEDQMQVYWNKASRKNKNQVRRIITSYSKKELDSEDPRSALIAAQIARRHIQEYYPDRQAAIFIQADGKGGMLHVHTLVNNVSMTECKGCSDEQTKFYYVAKTVDAVAKQYINLEMDYNEKVDQSGKKMKTPKEVVKQNERRQREENEAALTRGEATPNYIWKDDLKDRIRLAMSEAASREDFLKQLTAHGVEGEYRTGEHASKKAGEYIIYELVDTTGFTGKIPKNLKSKSYKIGTDFDLEMLDRKIAEHTTGIPARQPGQKTEPKPPAGSEADRKRWEHAEVFAKWCADNGMLYFDDSYNIDFDKWDKAEIMFKEYLHHVIRQII